ncbi:phage head-tail adaptor, putative [Alkaliphilus metalliredigens QYMF]|uniref:Phage head-tail adaptor, putative n=1 Tax=Alkaliphilus metalliredigens (strain QYMF) TaxID=293826 RepID=A6TQV3_ALKMQ|nr:phage head closure protein [Alkaliphilus metalliredigens]ABR48571.1 phage head-tail adaptor, putative [Alkaliphilus metalliredigens QYMF]
MNAGNLRYKVDVYAKVKFENELKETDYRDEKLKSIWTEIIPQTGSLKNQQVETMLSTVTHKIKCRYVSAKDITKDMHFIYKGHRFDIRYILNPYFKNETLEFFCEEVIE